MKILFDLNHPAHVHYFKHAIKKLRVRGYEVVVTARDKDITLNLLESESIAFLNRGSGRTSYIGKIFYYLYSVGRLCKFIRNEHVDLIVSFMHPYAVQAAWLTGVPSLVFSDTENATLHHKTTVPFATEVHTPFTFGLNLGNKHHRFNSFMELAYLNKNYFSPGKKYVGQDKRKVLVRFVSRLSVHDRRHSGLNDNQKIRLVNELATFCEVHISSEVELPEVLEHYRVKIPVEQIHEFMYSCDFVVGESATMSSESALLGTPAIYIDDEGRGYTDYFEKEHQLIFRVTESDKGINDAITIARKLSDEGHRRSWKDMVKLHENFMDTTDYIVNQVNRILSTTT